MVSWDLFRLFLLPLWRPVEGLQELLHHRKKVMYSVVIFLFLGILYTLSVQLAWSRGLGAMVEPFIKIPAGEYYYWQRFWQIPFFFITTILFAGIVRLLSLTVGGRGTFEDIFCILCVTQTLPMFLLLWLPETFGFLFFPGRAIMPVWLDVLRQVLSIIWPLVITVIGISRSERIRWEFSALFTLTAAIPMTAFMVIFVR